MAFAEAMTHGLPVVGCDGGAVADVVPPSAGILVGPGDLDGFAGALGALLDDAALREALSAGASEAARTLPTWTDSAHSLSQTLEAVR